ncbi:unnamed protein product, partial [Staurois parvus]
LNTLSHQQLEQSCDFYQCPAKHWLKLVEGVFVLPYKAAGPLTLCLLIGHVLITCTLSVKKKNKLSSNTQQTEHVQLVSKPLFYQKLYWGQ